MSILPRSSRDPVAVRDRITKINSAFRKLRRAGLIARQSFSCCVGCAGADLAHEVGMKSRQSRDKITGAVFYTKQDTEDRNIGRRIFLAFGPIEISDKSGNTIETVGRSTTQIGHMITAILSLEGVACAWDGDPDKRIVIDEIPKRRTK